jgi:hypothetical protein
MRCQGRSIACGARKEQPAPKPGRPVLVGLEYLHKRCHANELSLSGGELCLLAALVDVV